MGEWSGLTFQSIESTPRTFDGWNSAQWRRGLDANQWKANIDYREEREEILCWVSICVRSIMPTNMGKKSMTKSWLNMSLSMRFQTTD